MPKQILTQGEFDHMLAFARREVDASGYGMWVSDAKIAAYIDKAFAALEAYWKEHPEER
jgi:hypothetical protein